MTKTSQIRSFSPAGRSERFEFQRPRERSRHPRDGGSNGPPQAQLNPLSEAYVGGKKAQSEKPSRSPLPSPPPSP